MRSKAGILAILLLTLALAGCASDSGNGPTSGPAQPYVVKVMKNHALQEKSRTIKADLHQGGAMVGTGSFTVTPSDPETPVEVYSRTVPAGEVQVKAYEGSNPVGVKSFDPARCPKPLEIELHVVDDAVHVYSNCD